jgi:hypothetical protein
MPENGEGLHLPRGGRRGRRDSDAAGEELELDGAAPLPLLFATSSTPPLHRARHATVSYCGPCAEGRVGKRRGGAAGEAKLRAEAQLLPASSPSRPPPPSLSPIHPRPVSFSPRHLQLLLPPPTSLLLPPPALSIEAAAMPASSPSRPPRPSLSPIHPRPDPTQTPTRDPSHVPCHAGGVAITINRSPPEPLPSPPTPSAGAVSIATNYSLTICNNHFHSVSGID